MFKKYISVFLILCSLFSYAQKKETIYSKEQKKVPKINIPTSASIPLYNAANAFNDSFKKVTGKYLNIERSNSLNKKHSYIILKLNSNQEENYCYYKEDKNITIQATTSQNLIYGINDFFKRFTDLNFEEKYNKSVKKATINELKTPENFNYCSSPDFEYREPYFSTNFNPNFRAWNKTNYLELEWGIWGHNMSKVLKKYNLSDSIYAKVGGNRDQNQFCFTSDLLFKHVNNEVKSIYESDNALNKYMILPNDNNLVCTCNKCIETGNTSTDAAPAVFTFLNKLAKENKNLTFFTTAYITVKEIPKFKSENNVGLFYSTINIQKGVPIENTKYFTNFKYDIKRWKKYLKNVYIWDYTVNFDNYFDIYPSIKVTQKNLQLYKKLGVSGVFLHGSEYEYSVFQDLKSTLFSNLLWNTEININQEVEKYFNEKFPKDLAEVLSNYYLSIENVFFKNNKELSIYSGLNKSLAKYLNPKDFILFYNKFESYTERHKHDKAFLKIATALTFLKLEIMRSSGIGEFGYADINKSKEIIIKPEVSVLLNNLIAFSKKAQISTYNEVNYKIEDYTKSWREKILEYKNRKHYFYKKPFKVLSRLDEDYKDSKILNDGTFGLKDYNTNWLICSTDNLILKIEKKQIEESKRISFSFLQDAKHYIYYPSKIEILDINNKIIKKLNLPNDRLILSTKEVSISLPKKNGEIQLPEIFVIKITRGNLYGKNALACDEITFN